ncbi:MAG: hypothetical protein CBE23_001540 [Candidatus Pelagibacter sp. TMED263]|nr:MAG: hypothetical protein CBE23_001540 [Candidatus Pelagibacter sp. TMED263]|tara:strand:- start:484 stop:990 length:507 start_codon:yes stop_codon:yes gene_type:complete
MENEHTEQFDLIKKISVIVIKRKKLFLTILFIIVAILSIMIFFNYYQNIQNIKVSEKYVKAGIHLSSKDKEKAKSIYKEIVLSENKFYSILALNNLLENNLETDNEEILNLFKTVENINTTKEQKNLVKLKKALFFKKISKNQEGNKLLEEIIADNSIWKDTALEISQ